MTHPLIVRGRQAFQAGDLSAALSLAGMRLQEAQDLDALELKSVVLQARGDMAGAEAVMRQALAIDPACAWAAADLTRLLHAQGQSRQAEAAARLAVIARPDDAQNHLQLAVLLAEKDDLPAAEFHNRRTLHLAGPHPEILVNLGLTLYNQGRLDEAEEALAEALRLRPDQAMIAAHISRVYEARRNMNLAFAWLERAEKIAETSGHDFTLLRARYLAEADQPLEALTLIDRYPGTLNAGAELERARLLDRLQRYEEAWPAMVAAKMRIAAETGRTYDAVQVADEFGAAMAFFTRDTFGRLPRAATRREAPTPIFILGFPRTGTTMIEQMLNSHPSVAAGGELPFVHEWRQLVADLLPGSGFPGNLAHTETFDLHYIPGVLRDYYLGRIETYGVIRDGEPIVTDKMPLNDVHLPLIRLAFPNAPVVRMVRHPLDTALSMLSHDLTHGYNCGYAMETIIAHMKAVHALNQHYDQALDHPQMTVRYEDFVNDQEAQTRRILGHCGLDFDPACLRFHENPRHAPTPSYAQVSRPLNTRSVGRWTAYRAFLAPYLDDIAPVVEALGYSL